MAYSDKSVNDYIDDIISRFDKSLKNPDISDRRHEAFTNEKQALVETVDELKRLRFLTKPIPKTLGDISDLPAELIAELSAVKTDDLEDQIFTIINAAGGEANIDTILVELFRRYTVVQKRTYLTNKLWRMTQKEGLIWPSEGKGYYTTEEPAKSMPGGVTPKPFDLDDDIPF